MKCKHTTTITQRGQWGPHRAKKICLDCGKHVKWVAITKSLYERRKGVKYKDVRAQTHSKTG